MINHTDQPQRSPGKTIARNTIFGMGAQLALRGLNLLFSIFIIRRLGDVGFGQYSVVLAWAGIFSFIGDMGITQYMTREIARDREKALTLFWDVAALRLILAMLTIAVTLLGAVYMSYSPEIVLAIFIFSLTYLLQAFLAPLIGVIAGYERLDIVSVMTVLGQIIFLASAGAFLIIDPNFIWLVVASLVNLPILIGLSLWIVLRNHMSPPPFKLNPTIWMALLRFGLPFAFIQVSLTFAFRFDTLVLEKNFSEDVVGWYNAAYTLTRSFLILTSAFSVALVPTMAREYLLNTEAIRPWYFRSVKFIALMGLPLATGGMILADKIIIFLYGKEFYPAIPAFAILVWDTPLLMYTSICGNITTAMKKEAVVAWIYGSEGLFNIIMNLILIPKYGILAASTVTVATELVGTILFYRLFRRELGSGLGFTSMIRLGLAVVMMGVAIFLLRDVHIFILIPFGVVLYGLLVWALRVLTPDELDLLASSFRRAKKALGNRI